MTMRATILLALASVLGMPATTLAAADCGVYSSAAATAEILKGFNDAGDYGQTWAEYRFCTDAIEQWEGDTSVDFELGLAAIETGNFSDAVFMLDRVLISVPGNLRVRLELARAYFFAGDLPSARREFNVVLDSGPPPNVRDNIMLFLGRIDMAERSQRRTIEYDFSLGGGHDTNVNSAVADATIGTPIGVVSLDPNSIEQEDEFVRLFLGARWVEPLTQYSSFDLSASAAIKDNFEVDEFDLGIFTLQGGYSRQVGKGRIRAGGRLQQVTLDYSGFQGNYAALFSYDRPLGTQTLVSITGAATVIEYDDQSNRDTYQFLVSGGLARQFGQWTHSFSLFGADEPAQNGDGDFFGRTFIGGQYNARWEMEHLVPYARALYQSSRYDDEQPVFGEIREDDYLAASAGVLWRPELGARADRWGLAFTAEIAYTEIDSNLPIFSYDRTVFEVGLQSHF